MPREAYDVALSELIIIRTDTVSAFFFAKKLRSEQSTFRQAARRSPKKV
jgi:hypothetical protein